MRYNSAFGIMLGLALAGLLILQVVAIADAHIITAPPAFSTPAVGVRDLVDTTICDVEGAFRCPSEHYCFYDPPYALGCCPNGEQCTGYTVCFGSAQLSTKVCNPSTGCLACSDGYSSVCASRINHGLMMTMMFCDVEVYTILSTNPADTLQKYVSTRTRHSTTSAIIVTSTEQSTQVAQQTSLITTSTSEPGQSASVTPEQTSLITTLTSKSGQSASIVTVTIAQANTTIPDQITSSDAAPTNATSALPHPHASNHSRAKTAGIAVGVMVVISIAITISWFAWRRHRRNANAIRITQHHHTAPWQSPDSGPHEVHHTATVELTDSSRRQEMDANPEPRELHSPPPVSPPPVSPLSSSLFPSNEDATPRRSPVSPMVPSRPVSSSGSASAGGKDEESNNNTSAMESNNNTTSAMERDLGSGRYGPGGFLNPEYALRDGLWEGEDERQVRNSVVSFGTF